MDASPLNRLATELRLAIYELTFTQPTPISLQFYDVETKHPIFTDEVEGHLLALTETCRQIRRECDDLFHHLNTFTLASFSPCTSSDSSDKWADATTSFISSTALAVRPHNLVIVPFLKVSNRGLFVWSTLCSMRHDDGVDGDGEYDYGRELVCFKDKIRRTLTFSIPRERSVRAAVELLLFLEKDKGMCERYAVALGATDGLSFLRDAADVLQKESREYRCSRMFRVEMEGIVKFLRGWERAAPWVECEHDSRSAAK